LGRVNIPANLVIIWLGTFLGYLLGAWLGAVLMSSLGNKRAERVQRQFGLRALLWLTLGCAVLSSMVKIGALWHLLEVVFVVTLLATYYYYWILRTILVFLGRQIDVGPLFIRRLLAADGSADDAESGEGSRIFKQVERSEVESETGGADWYYRQMDDILGPVTLDELCDMLGHGKITRDTLIRNGRDGKWLAAWRVRVLYVHHVSKKGEARGEWGQTDFSR